MTEFRASLLDLQSSVQLSVTAKQVHLHHVDTDIFPKLDSTNSSSACSFLIEYTVRMINIITYFGDRGLWNPLPASSGLAALFLSLALGCVPVGLRALRSLFLLLHLALLQAVCWSSCLLAFYSLSGRWARTEGPESEESTFNCLKNQEVLRTA